MRPHRFRHPFGWFTVPAAAFLLLALSGCEKNTASQADFSVTPPSLSRPGIAPVAVNVDSLTQEGGVYHLAVAVTVSANDPDGAGDIATVRAEVIRPGGGSPISQDFLQPTDPAGDTLYSGTVHFTATRAQTGTYRIRFIAQDRAGLRSSAIEQSCLLTRNNSRPTLDPTSLDAPDTIARPPTGTLLFHVAIAAADSDGLDDVARVFLRSLSTGTTFPLLDDGMGIQGNAVTSGDSLAGDGIFTITFRLSATDPASTLQFALQAVDTFHDTSDVVPYTLVIQ